eukprot:1078725_1
MQDLCQETFANVSVFPCLDPIDPDAESLQSSVAFTRNQCNFVPNCAEWLDDLRILLYGACPASNVATLNQFEIDFSDAIQICESDDSRFCFAAADFLTNEMATSARARDSDIISLGACSSLCIDMLGTTCRQQKMRFNCAQSLTGGRTCLQLYNENPD